jgi:RNA polymerase sigma factor (sigma-70 family)
MDTQALNLATYVPAAARGDREAFATLVNETRSLVSAIALSIVRDGELSRDIAQDVFLSAWRDLGSLRDPNSFLPWLRQLTRHRAYHLLRTERRRERRVTADDTDTLLAQAADPQPDAGMRMIADEERRLLALVLDELPDETRDVVILYYREGESTEQVARLLGLTEANVRQRLSRARTRLRASLLDRFGMAARHSAPDAGFTAAVLTALAVGAPVASSAATLTAATTTVGQPLLLKVLAIGGGAALGAAGGLVGVLSGTRQLKRGARSASELQSLKRFELAAIVLTVSTAAAFPLSWQLTQQAWSQVATFAGFTAGLVGLYAIWLPRILKSRFALEAIEDPARAANARAKERRAAILGWTLGLTCGTLGLIAGILLAD